MAGGTSKQLKKALKFWVSLSSGLVRLNDCKEIRLINKCNAISSLISTVQGERALSGRLSPQRNHLEGVGATPQLFLLGPGSVKGCPGSNLPTLRTHLRRCYMEEMERVLFLNLFSCLNPRSSQYPLLNLDVAHSCHACSCDQSRVLHEFVLSSFRATQACGKQFHRLTMCCEKKSLLSVWNLPLSRKWSWKIIIQTLFIPRLSLWGTQGSFQKKKNP